MKDEEEKKVEVEEAKVAEEDEKIGEPKPASEETKAAETEADLNAKTVVQLKDLCKAKGLPVSGKKADLVERLVKVAVDSSERKKEEGEKEPAEAAKDGENGTSDAAKDVEMKEELAPPLVLAEEPVEEKEKEEGQAKVEEAAVDSSMEDPELKVINKQDFNRVIRIFYKVIKEIVLSDNLLIEQSRQIRRMDVGEVMEVHQGPMLDPSVGVYRVHGKALRDGILGWVTVAGNQGVTFLMPGGNVFQVVRPLVLTEELKDLDGSTSRVVKTLGEGKVLEVLEWARTSRSALGVTRIKARIQGDDDSVVGWATLADNEGKAYIEAA